MQDGPVDLHPALADARLQGLPGPSPQQQRLMSLHVRLVLLRCRHHAVLLRHVTEALGLAGHLQGRGDGGPSKAGAALVRRRCRSGDGR